jgi:hypothetical protein
MVLWREYAGARGRLFRLEKMFRSAVLNNEGRAVDLLPQLEAEMTRRVDAYNSIRHHTNDVHGDDRGAADTGAPPVGSSSRRPAAKKAAAGSRR